MNAAEPEIRPIEQVNPPAPEQLPSVAGIAMWDFAGRFASYAVVFAIGVLLARILSPAEFGASALVLSVVALSSIFVDLGFRSAVIQARKLNQEQLSTIFYINVVIAVLMISFFGVMAPYVERFYAIESLGSYILAASSLFLINALALIPGAMLQRNLQLKAASVINIVAAVVSGGFAVSLALTGFKVWALIIPQIVSGLATLVGLSMVSGWLPAITFRPSSIKELWHFGARMFISGVLETVFSRFDVFIIGKIFPIATLGFYNRAQGLDQFVRNFSTSTTTSVAFPVIAKMGEDLEAVRAFYIRCVHVIAFLSFLLIGVLFLTCLDLVVILFTERWITVGYYFRIMALTGFVYPLSALMVNLIAARGNSTSFLKLEIIKKAILLPTYISFLVAGMYSYLISLAVAYTIALVINAIYVDREIDISIRNQGAAVVEYAVVACVAVTVTYFAGYMLTNVYVHFVVTSVLFSSCYLTANYLIGMKGFFEIFDRVTHIYNVKRHPNISPAA